MYYPKSSIWDTKRASSISKKTKKKKKKEEVVKEKTVERKHIPVPRVRPTAYDTSEPRPEYWPSTVSKPLHELNETSPSVFRALEGEREEHLWFRKDPQERPWTLVELAINAMQMPLLLEGKAKGHYKEVTDFPPVLEDKFQSLLPVDVDVIRAIEVIEDGVFWKRLASEKFPHMKLTPSIQKLSYKSLFVQEWYSNYLSELEPYNVVYKDIQEMTKTVAPYVHVLDIKELKAPIFRKKEPPKAEADPALENMQWLKETCLPPFPYVQRIDLSTILPLLPNLTFLSICFGFSNYERYRCFRKSRINVKDIENLFKGIYSSLRIEGLRIYMSAFYETDMRVAIRSLLLFPVLLKRLEISNCELDDRAARMIGELILFHVCLEEINIKRNYLSRTGAYFIATALCMTELKTLKVLNISENGIGCVGATYFALMLTVNQHLGALYLSGCRIGRPGAMLILSALSLNKGLESLDISVNHLGSTSPEEEETIVNNMKNHPKLVELTAAECGWDIVLVEFLRLLSNQKLDTRSTYRESLGTVLVRKHANAPGIYNWNAYSRPTEDHDSVYTTESGELTTVGSSLSGQDETYERQRLPRKKLYRFIRATLTENLVMAAIQTILKQIHQLSILRAQETGRSIKSIFAEELATVPIKKLVKKEITRVLRKKMKKSKLFCKPEKIKTRTPVPKYVINNLIRTKLKRVPLKLVEKVINQTLKTVQNC